MLSWDVSIERHRDPTIVNTIRSINPIHAQVCPITNLPLNEYVLLLNKLVLLITLDKTGHALRISEVE